MLNEQQKQVVLHGDNPLQVVAGSGSGKSTVLKTRVAKLIKDGKSNIMVTTFTRNTSKDLKKKIFSMVLKDKYGNKINIKDKVTVGTFHSVCYKMMKCEGLNPDNLVVTYEVENIFKKLIKDPEISVGDILGFISYQKNNMITCDDKPKMKENLAYDKEVLTMCYKAYTQYQKETNRYDMDDYLLIGYDILKKNKDKYRFDYLLVDECQDSNEIQMKLIDEICPSHRVTTVGDFRQSLYSFRGSNPKLFMDFPNRYDNVKVINMDMNYRSDKQIVERANQFIRNYFGYYEYYEDSKSNSDEEGDIELMSSIDCTEESQQVCDKIQTLLGLGNEGKEIAVLYRNNVMSQDIENELKCRNIPYYIDSSVSYFDRKEIVCIINIMRLIKDMNDNTAYENVFKSRIEPFKYLKNSLLYDIISYAQDNDMSYLQASISIANPPFQKNRLDTFDRYIKMLNAKYEGGMELPLLLNDIYKTFDIERYVNSNWNTEEDRKERLISLENLKKYIKGHTLETFLKFAYEGGNSSNKKAKDNEVRLMTVHKSKGLEFDNVILVGVEKNKFPSDMTDIVEESCVFYVAVTRPRHKLIISQIGSDNKFVKEYMGDKEIDL